MKWFKRILLLLVLIALFIVSALITVAIVVDPNDYKPQIEALVETHTGRDLAIEGEIGLSLFPWLGLELTNVSLGNPEGFSEPRFAAVEKVNIKVALLPLFKLQTRVGVLQLKGLRLNLETRADGVSNWEGLGQTGEAPAVPETPAESPAPAPEPPTAGSDAAAKALAGLYVGGIDIEDAAIILRDEVNAMQTRVEHINLNTGAIRINEPIDFKASFSVRNDEPKLIGGLELRGTAVADVNNARYWLTNIALNGKVSGVAIPGHEQALDLTIESIAADLNAGTAAVKAVSARLAGLTAGLDVSATGIDGDAPAVTGKVNLQIDSLKRTLGTLAVPLPITADEAVLETVTLNAGFKAGKDAIEVSDIAAALDDSHLTGQLAVRGFEQPAITFDLALDALNADRYLPPADESPQAETPPADETDTEIELPVETLRTLDIDGRFRIGALQVMNLKTANIDTGLKAKGGAIDLKPLAVDLYQGTFRGSAGLDVTGDIPRYTSTLQLDGITIGPLMQDFMDKRLLEGIMNADATVNTAGSRVSGLMEELDGKFSLAFRDGALSMNVRESMRNLKAKLKGREPAAGPLGEPTKFSSITATGVIENGTVKNQDLEVRARQLYVTGKGSYQLPTDYIDYVLTILLSDDGAGQDDSLNDLYDFPIEFPLKGKLSEIDYASVGLKALGSAVTNKVKAKVDAAKDAAKAELQRKQEAARAELEKKEAARRAELQRAEEAKKAELERERKAKEEELKKKLEDKKKEALKNLFH